MIYVLDGIDGDVWENMKLMVMLKVIQKIEIFNVNKFYEYNLVN